MNVYPEAFDLFDLAVERDIPTFIDKSLPIIRRLKNTTLIDVRLLKNLLPLSLAEHFDSKYFSSLLKTSDKHITFFTTLSRLAIDSTRQKELEDLADPNGLQVSKKVLTTLKIELDELVAITRIAFNLYGDQSNSLVDTLKTLKIKVVTEMSDTKADDSIVGDHVGGLMALNSGNEVVDILSIKNHLKCLKKNANHLLDVLLFRNRDDHKADRKDDENINKEDHQKNEKQEEKKLDMCFLVSRIAAGNFLVFRHEKEKFSWAFSYKGRSMDGKRSSPDKSMLHEEDKPSILKAKQTSVAVRDLTMAVAGLINPNVQIKKNLNLKVQSFVKKFYHNEFKDLKHQKGNTILPENSLDYAIYLAYHTMDIFPSWTQSFFFDQAVFSKLIERSSESDTSTLKREMILAIILNFTHMSDRFMDYIGFYEFDASLRVCCERSKQDLDKPLEPGPFTKVKESDKEVPGMVRFTNAFNDIIKFDYETILELAKSEGLLQDSYWHNLLVSSEASDQVREFNRNMNMSILYLIKKEFKEFKGSKVPLETYYEQPKEFLKQLEGLVTKKLRKLRSDLSEVTTGELIKIVIVQAYRAVIEECQWDHLRKYKEKEVGFEMTNLCMLGTIMSLRESSQQKKSHKKTINKLYLLASNLERKMFLNDYLDRFSKFKLIKLAGYSLGLRIGNIFEWCLPDALLTTGKNLYITCF